MKRTSSFLTVLGLLLVISCGDGSEGPGPGNGNTCKSSCDSGFKCGSSGTCELDPIGYWVIIVTNGWVNEKNPSGSTWDSAGGLPDPFVCLTINNDRRCTSAIQNTTKPSWNASFPAATATALQSGITIEYWDEDLSTHDKICKPSSIAIGPDDFKSGAVKITCGSPEYANFNMILSAQ